jgi:hypothetical protein
MSSSGTGNPVTFEEVVTALHRGDFSRLSPLFEWTDRKSPLINWVLEGRFARDRAALNEAVSCACFLGQTAMVEFLLEHGADPIAGNGTGLNGLHWATNRGQLQVVRILLARELPLETRNSYGGTVLGGTVWASVHEPRPEHPAIIEALLHAGADVRDAEYPSGNLAVDRILERHGAGKRQR